MARFRPVPVLCLTAIILSFASMATPAELEIGVAVTDITPPTAYRMSGYFHERLSSGAHDPLRAKALVFRQGETQAALVFCDLIGISLDVSRRARKEAERRTGIPVSNILIAATHSHTGPLYFGALRDHFHVRALAKSGDDPHEKVDYPKLLASRLADAIAEAQKSVAPAELDAGTTRQEGLSFNRRFHMKTGTVRFNPGKKNPDIIRPAGPTDPDVGLLLVRDPESGKARAGLSVFALHLDTVGGGLYSADFPLYLERTLRSSLGEDFVSMFGAGTCGDINHIDVSHTNRQKGQEEAKRIGDALGATVNEAFGKLAAVKNPTLAVRSATVAVGLQEFKESEQAEARRNMEMVGTSELPFLAQVQAYKVLAVALRRQKSDTIPLEAQVFRLSDKVAIVGLPGEVFVELGLAIKNASPFETTIVVELANDAPGYIPTEKAFREGSYETVNSRVKPGGGERLVEAAVGLLKELAPTRTAVLEIPPETAAEAARRHERVAERRSRVQVICHRGALEFAHENTLEAYRATFALGGDGNEIDIRSTRDGVLICFHDDMLDNLLEAYGDASDYTWDELKRFRFRNPGPFARHCRIPTLIEALQLHRVHAGLLHLDIKRAGLDAATARLLDRMDMWNHVVQVNRVNAGTIVKDSRLKLGRYKTGLYLDGSEVDPEAIAAAQTPHTPSGSSSDLRPK